MVLMAWMFVNLQVDYEPGDHVGIYPTNSSVIVNGILNRLCGVDDHDEILQLQILKETHSTNGKFNLLLTTVNYFLKKYFVVLRIFIWRYRKKLGTTWPIASMFIENIADAILRFNYASFKTATYIASVILWW